MLPGTAMASVVLSGQGKPKALVLRCDAQEGLEYVRTVSLQLR